MPMNVVGLAGIAGMLVAGGQPHQFRAAFIEPEPERAAAGGTAPVGPAGAGDSAGISIPGSVAGADGAGAGPCGTPGGIGAPGYSAGCGSAGRPLGAYTPRCVGGAG